MISMQELRLHCRGRTCAFKESCSIVLMWLCKGLLRTYGHFSLYSHFSLNTHSFLQSTVSCAVPVSSMMACLWVVLEAQWSAWSLQELKLKIAPANQSMGATGQAFRHNQKHFKNYDLWGDLVMWRLTWIYCCSARNPSLLKDFLENQCASELPCSQTEGNELNYRPRSAGEFSSLMFSTESKKSSKT